MPDPLPEVLLVSGRFQVRGSSVQTLNLARRLPAAGFHARIVCADAGLLPPGQRAEFNVTEIPQLDSRVLGPIVQRLFLRELPATRRKSCMCSSGRRCRSGNGWRARSDGR